MKVTIDIQDELLRRARRCAQRTGRTLRAVVADGLRLALAKPQAPEKPPAPRRAHRWEDLSVGEPGDPNPFEQYTWAEMLALSYGPPTED